MNLSLSELAKKLNLPESTVERWIKQGRMPVHKESGKCIFNKSSLIKWASKHNLKFMIFEENNKIGDDKKELTFLSSMENGEVFYDVKGEDIYGVLENAVNKISSFDENQKKDLLAKLIERENLTSTGIGNGIAIPHPRVPVENFSESAVITCFIDGTVDFNAIDGKPVFILFILLSPSTKEHLSLLSKLAFCMRDISFVEFLKSKPSKDSLIEKVSEFENKS
ncbi:MAG: PTS transporter subunit EIIA [Desulfobacterales bacterium]|nr:PTS transporter subunit EIIA [Desulfobacterales bacterium]MCP4160721.1 PTS transporter subunit EIIA [Deltaproteobacteria bacterium]